MARDGTIGAGDATRAHVQRQHLAGGQWVFLGQVVTSGSNLITAVLLIRVLGLEAFGQFSLCFLMLMLVRTYFVGAILAPTSALSARLNSVSGPAFRGFLVAITLGFAIATSALLGLLLLGFSVPTDAPWMTALAPAVVVANAAANLSEMGSRYHVAQDRPQRACLIEVARHGTQLSALAIVIWLPEIALTPATALLALALGAAVGAATAARHIGPFAWSRRLSAALWRRFATFLRWMSAANLVETVQTLGPNLIGLAVLGEAALGLFRAVGQITNALNLPVNALQQTLPGIAAKIRRKSGDAGMLRGLRALVGCIGLYFAAAGLGLYLAAPVVAALLFQTEPPGFRLFLVLFIAANFFIAARMIMAAAFVSRGTPQPMVLIQGVSAVVALALAALAGIAGAVMLPVSVALSTLIGLVLCFHFAAMGARDG